MKRPRSSLALDQKLKVRGSRFGTGMFPFSRAKIAIGLENLRKAYGNFGYINFTSVPDTTFDDENHSISLDIDMDEGMQFVIGGVNVLGLDEPARQELLDGLPIKPGQI